MPKRRRESGAACDDSEPRTPAKIFADFQEAGSYLHEKLQNELEKFYEGKVEKKDEMFDEYFRTPMLVLLTGSYSSPFVKKVIPFIVDFIAKRLAEEDEDEERETACPFLAKIFDLFWEVQNYDDKNIRYNVCKIISDLLAKLAEKDISMDDALCEKISHTMISGRITDKAVDVRELASKCLQWLQDSLNPTCHITKTLLYHLDKDPSVEVRKSILNGIRVSSVTILSIVKRTRDVNESVRLTAFKLLADRRRMNSFSYNLREKIIMSGLRDTSQAVRDVTETYLLPKWLEHLQGDLVEFVNNLDVHFRPAVPRQALPCLFKTKTTDELIAFLNIPEGERYPAPESLTPPLALYWATLAKYFKDNDETDALERIIGSITELTLYINCFYKQEIPKDKDLADEKEKDSKVFKITILLFLLDLFSLCDMSDEVGRANMAELMLEILKSDDHAPDRRLLSKVTSQLSSGLPDPFNRVETVMNLLLDLYSPYVHPQQETNVPTLTDDQKRALNVAIAYLKKDVCNLQISQEKAIENQKFSEAEDFKTKIVAVRDAIKKKEEELKGPVVLESQDDALDREDTKNPSIQYKCLIILCELLKNTDVFQVSMGFADIVEKFVKKCVSIDQEHIMVNALEALGLYCMHSPQNAKKYLPLFYVILINDIRPYDGVRSKCLQCIATLLVHHGREALQIPDDEWVLSADVTRYETINKDGSQTGYLHCLVNNMQNESDSVKRQAIIGACQLLLSGRISSSQLLSKIILLWFLPTTSSCNALVRLIGNFLSRFAAEIDGAPKMLTESLFISLDELINCSHSSDLQELDAREVGLFILDLTRPGTNKYSEDNHHDVMARLLLEKLEFEDNNEAQLVYLRLLVNLAISYDNADIRNSLLEIIRRVKQNNLANCKHRDLLRLLLNLQGVAPTEPSEENVSSTPRSPAHRRTLIRDKENLITPIRKSFPIDDDEEEPMETDNDDEVFKTPPKRPIRN